MDITVPSKQQDQSAHLAQQSTPPSTPVSGRGTTMAVNYHDQQLQPQEHKKPLESQEAQDKTEHEDQNMEASTTQKPESTTHQLDVDELPESDVSKWIYSAASVEQRRQRFYSVLHASYPSNAVYNTFQHPFYDAKEDGSYSDFIKGEMSDGNGLYDDEDDHSPYTDPESTEVWQPKIGDEGIKNEEDLHMVLKSRKEDQTRACRRYESMSNSDEGAAADSEIGVLPLQIIHDSNGIRVYGALEEHINDEQPRPKKKSNKRKRKGNPNSTYKYESDSEDEKPARKKSRKVEGAAGDADAGDMQWRAQTRAAARRHSHTGMDGSYDADIESSPGWSSDSSDETWESNSPGEICGQLLHLLCCIAS